MKLHSAREELHVSDSDISGSRFVHAKLASSRFDDVNLQEAAFSNVNLRQVTFSNVNLTSASIANANLAGMKIDGVLVSELFAAWRRRSGAVLFAKNLAAVSEFYRRVLELAVQHADAEHVVLSANALQLIVHQIPAHVAPAHVAPAYVALGIEIESPPKLRTDSALKLVFHVSNMAVARERARQHGGDLSGPEHEWEYQGFRICDGMDPEGNVVQFREPSGEHCVGEGH